MNLSECLTDFFKNIFQRKTLQGKISSLVKKLLYTSSFHYELKNNTNFVP